MSEGFARKKKVITIQNVKIVLRSLTLNELEIIFEDMKTKGAITGAKTTLKYGIVSPAILRDNPGSINAELAVVLSAEILQLTGIAYTPPFNPSKR